MRRTDKKTIVLNEVDSTNNYANQLILSNAADDGTVVMTHFQTKGKGQQGNQWESEFGKNLLISLILFPKELPAEKQFYISKISSLALVNFLEKRIEGVTIKWPNDIYVENNKIAGMLIENTVKGTLLHSSVLGIGLNINQEKFVSDAPNPVSLKQITGKDYSIPSITHEISNLIFNWYKKLLQKEHEAIDMAYFSNLYRKEEWQHFSMNTNVFEAKIIGVGKFGQLIMEMRDGKRKEFMFKEVEFII